MSKIGKKSKSTWHNTGSWTKRKMTLLLQFITKENFMFHFFVKVKKHQKVDIHLHFQVHRQKWNIWLFVCRAKEAKQDVWKSLKMSHFAKNVCVKSQIFRKPYYGIQIFCEWVMRRFWWFLNTADSSLLLFFAGSLIKCHMIFGNL